jgi:tetratricopeptide (TPR) repeat protein
MNNPMKRIGVTLALGMVVALGAGPAFAQYTGGGSTKMLNTETMDPTLQYKMGVEYIQQKDYQRAVQVLREVLAKRDSDPAANLMMGVAQIGLNDLNEAKRYLARAVSSKPDLADAIGRLGWVEAKLGNTAGAQAQRETLTKLKDKCAGKCPEAAAIDAAFATLDGAPAAGKPKVSVAARFNQGVDALTAKNFAEADAAFGDVMAQKPDDWEAAYMRGQAQAALNNYAGAKASLEAAVKLQPGLVDGKARLAVAEKKLGNADAAAAIRVSLVASQDKCGGTCAGSKAIADAIAMVDAAK